MSRNYHQICNNINDFNNSMLQKEALIKEIWDIKSELKIVEKKIDKIYSLIVRLINEKEY